MRILLVDDSKTMRNIQKNVLAEAGYTEVEEAYDGQDALSKAAVFKPQLTLVDGDMPNMDGITFVKAYRGQGHKTPIIMVASDSEKSHVLEAIEAGVNNYIIKPFTPVTLSQRVSDTLARFEAA